MRNTFYLAVVLVGTVSFYTRKLSLPHFSILTNRLPCLQEQKNVALKNLFIIELVDYFNKLKIGNHYPTAFLIPDSLAPNCTLN